MSEKTGEKLKAVVMFVVLGILVGYIMVLLPGAIDHALGIPPEARP